MSITLLDNILPAVLVILIFLIVVIILVFEVWMFISAITNKKITNTAKVLWAIGMLLFAPFVAIVYFFTDYKKTK